MTDFERKPMGYPYLASRGNLFHVDAKQSWQDTNVQLLPGDNVSIIQVGGQWTNTPTSVDKWFDANGSTASGFRENYPLTSALGGALIGRIGSDGDPFLVGRWNVIEVVDEGSLWLTMNGDVLSDNDGLITVQISVVQAEEP